jgi:hypothetical protein
MEKLTALTKRIFNFKTQTGNNALARLEDVNKVIENIASNYLVGASGESISAPTNQVNIPAQPAITTYLATFNESVTSLLGVNTKVQIAVVDSGKLNFHFRRITVTISNEQGAWDGGDLELYLGNSLIGKINSADLILPQAGTSAIISVALNNNVRLASGTYDSVNGPVTTNTKIVNVRLSAATSTFRGFVGIDIATWHDVDCGYWCASECIYDAKASKKYCSSIKGGCTFCPTLGLSATQVIPI